MQTKTFVSERGRLIAVVIDKYISFQFPTENDREFYWIEKEDWAKDRANWVRQIESKSSYTEDMTMFIDKSILHKWQS